MRTCGKNIIHLLGFSLWAILVRQEIVGARYLMWVCRKKAYAIWKQNYMKRLCLKRKCCASLGCVVNLPFLFSIFFYLRLRYSWKSSMQGQMSENGNRTLDCRRGQRALHLVFKTPIMGKISMGSQPKNDDCNQGKCSSGLMNWNGNLLKLWGKKRKTLTICMFWLIR